MKIVKHLKTEEYGVKCMKKMLKKLENENEDGFGSERKNKSMSPKKMRDTAIRTSGGDSTGIGADGKPPKKFAEMHLDVVPESMKVKRLQGAIKTCTDKVFESRAITAWRYTGNKDTMENAIYKDYLQRPDKKEEKVYDSEEEEEMKKKKEESEDEEGKTRTLPRVPLDRFKKKTFDKKYKDLAKFPFMREGEDDDDNDEDDEYPEPEVNKQKPFKAKAKVEHDKNDDFGGGGDLMGGFDDDF